MKNQSARSTFTLTRNLGCIALASSALFLAACNKAAPDKPVADAGVLTTNEQKVSYGIGYSMGTDVAQQGGFKIDPAAMKAGIDDGLATTKTRISEADLQAAFQVVQQQMAAAAAEQSGKNLAEGTSFLEKNKKRPGVITTASGLQYEVLKSGSGPKPQAFSTVVVTYHGTLIDGTVFDSSVERGDTAEFQVNGVIKGWTEALQLMSVGDKWKLYIPAELGYALRARPKIPANSTLIFEVELLEIK